MKPDSVATSQSAVVRRTLTHTMSRGRYAGRTFELMQLGIRDLVQCQEEAAEEYKRQTLQTYTRNVDLIPQDMREKLIQDAFAATSALHYEHLPRQVIKFPKLDESGSPVVNEAGEVELVPTPVDYVMWWIGDTIQGKLFATWLSMRKCPSNGQLTLDDVDQIFIDSIGDLQTASDKIGRLSNPRVLGNDDAPEEAATPPAQKTRRERMRERRRRKLLTGQ